MKEFELIFVPLKHENEYVAPQYLPANFTEPKSHLQYKKACKEGFYLRFADFLPRSIMARFICRYGKLTEHDFCKNGISFEFLPEKGRVESTACRVLVEASEPLVIHVATERDDQVVYEGLFNGLFEIIDSSQKDLDFDLSRNGQDYVKLSLLKRREWKEEEMILTESGEFRAGDFAFAQQKLFRDHVEPERSFGRVALPVPEITPMEMDLPSPFNDQSTTTILFASANSDQHTKLKLEEEQREIKAEIRNAARVDFETSPATRYRDLNRDLNQYSPQVLHFSGHGSQGGIELMGDDDKLDYELSNDRIKKMLKTFDDCLKLVVLNSCYSFEQAKGISELGIPVICMLSPIEDKEAINFSIGLYQALVNKRTVQKALQSGQNMMDKQTDTPALWYKGHRIA
jgi:hypothetical protein